MPKRSMFKKFNAFPNQAKPRFSSGVFPAHNFSSGLAIAMALLATTLTGCAPSKMDEVVQLARCAKAGATIEDGELAAAAERKMSALSGQVKGNAREAMEFAQKINDELYPQGTSTNPAHVLKLAQEWKDSNYCQKIVGEFREHIKDLATLHSQPVPDPKAPASCQQFAEQYELSYYPYAKAYEKQLNEAVKGTIKLAAKSLKDYQQKYVNESLESAHPDEVAGVLNQACAGGGPISEKIRLLGVIHELESPRSIYLAKYIADHDGETDCGELKDVFCKAHLMRDAAESAHSVSRQCDLDEAPADVCALDEQALLRKENLKFELEALSQAKQKYESYISAPEKSNPNTDGNIYLLSEKCKSKAARQFTGEAYTDYVNRVCLPEAREEFLRPEKNLLAKINARLAELARAN